MSERRGECCLCFTLPIKHAATSKPSFCFATAVLKETSYQLHTRAPQRRAVAIWAPQASVGVSQTSHCLLWLSDHSEQGRGLVWAAPLVCPDAACPGDGNISPR